jgi:tetratricopeptide (TPR) repeat protein
VQACPPSAGYRLQKFVRRHKGPVAASLALAALLVLGMVGTSIGLVWAWRAEAKAKEEAAIAKAVNDFLLEDLLGQAEPDKNPRNKKVTVEELLDRAATRIAGKFAQQPAAEARIRRTIGNTYRALSNYSAARPHLERAWALCRSALGEESLDSLYVLSDLAQLYPPRDAAPLFRKVLEVRTRVLGEENPDTLSSMSHLADAYRGQGRTSDAERLFLKMLAINRGVLGDDTPDTLSAKNDLGLLYLGQGRYTEAERLLAEVVKVASRVLGEESTGRLTAMNNLSAVYLNKGEYLKAAELFEKTLEISGRVRGEDHDLTLQVTNNLALAYRSAGKLDRSVPLYEKLVPKRVAAFGTADEGTIRAMYNLGVNYRDAGRLPEAIAKLQQAWEWSQKKPDPEPRDSIAVALAEAYDRAGQFASSEPLYREALKSARKHHGEGSLKVADALDSLGWHLLKQRKHAEADSLLRESLAIREQTQPDDGKTPYTMSLVGGSLLGQKKYAEAEPLLLSGYAGMRQRERGIALPILKFRLTEAIERLVQLYEAWGKPEKAAERRAKLPPLAAERPADVFARP